MACPNPVDVLQKRAEDLSETLYVRASWRDPILNLIPRGEYANGAGYVRSTFEVGRSEPESDEETWGAIPNLTDNAATGACGVTYNAVDVGFKKNDYEPEVFGLRGPLMCQDDFVMHWKSAEFWEKYYQALEKRNKKSISNRLLTVYRSYVPKASANSSFAFIAGDTATQPAASTLDTTGLDGANLPTSEMTQEMLDATALELMEEGASDPNSNGWITMGESGPEFPLYIGAWASKRLKLNNPELRSDINQSFQGRGDVNPVLQRLGSSYVLGNFRHVINLFPARWKLVDGLLVRVPTWVMSNNASYATKGKVAIINPDWRNPAVAAYESAEVLNPWVMTEEILMPVNSLPGAKLKPQNYFGEWTYVTGNDAVQGFDDCTGIADPTHKRGRHFAEYRHALKPIFPAYGRMILFKRCADAYDTITCS
jgi:hypothetical protein